ncbi:hypothetical protein [Sorangium sp. So ce1024]|uniref:hypothetical protein n=1 Tax=Sorangium sp. So ce1024 TaxID=3133327 RepID=UPI003F01557E
MTETQRRRERDGRDREREERRAYEAALREARGELDVYHGAAEEQVPAEGWVP